MARLLVVLAVAVVICVAVLSIVWLIVPSDRRPAVPFFVKVGAYTVWSMLLLAFIVGVGMAISLTVENAS